jgi:hypothetical protein
MAEDSEHTITGRLIHNQKEIRVGIVGANAKKSWAKVSRVPAINDSPGLKLAAVATSNEQSAREAEEAFGANAGFSDSLTMIRDELYLEKLLGSLNFLLPRFI